MRERGALEETCTLTRIRADAVSVPTLEVVVETEAGQGQLPTAVPLRLDPVLVGSSPECEVVLPDRRVSRRHCSLALGEDGLVLTDLGSKNGTFIGDVAIREARIVPGTLVAVGGARLSVRVAGSPSVLALSPLPRFGEAIGGSVPMRALFARLRVAAASEEKILLRGESGTGKELLARAVHDESAR